MKTLEEYEKYPESWIRELYGCGCERIGPSYVEKCPEHHRLVVSRHPVSDVVKYLKEHRRDGQRNPRD